MRVQHASDRERSLSAQHYTQANLLSNTAGVAPVTDPGSVVTTARRPMVASDQATASSTLYNGAGFKRCVPRDIGFFKASRSDLCHRHLTLIY